MADSSALHLENLTSWKPGQSGNPSGKPKGTKNFSTLIRDMVENPKYKVRLKDGTVVKHPGAKIVHQMAIKAMEGDVQAATWLTKFGYGEKLVSEVDVTSGGERVGNTVNLQVGSDFAAYMLEKTKQLPEVVVDNTTDNGSTKP